MVKPIGERIEQGTIGIPSAGDIKLAEEPVRRARVLPITFIPSKDLSDVTVRFSEWGNADAPHVTESAFHALGQGTSNTIRLALADQLLRPSEDRLPVRDALQPKPESKLFLLVVQGTLSDERQAYSGEVVAFLPQDNGTFKAVTLHEYLNRTGKDAGSLGTLAQEEISAQGSGISSKADPVKKADRFMDAGGNVTVGDSNSGSKQRGIAGENTPTVQSMITVDVSGYIYYEDSNGIQRPLADVEVAVWEDDGSSAHASFDNILLTSSTGYFETTVEHDDGDGSLELFLRVRTENSWLRIGNYYDDGDGTGNCHSGNQYCGLADSGNIYFWTGPTVTGITGGSEQMNYTISDSRSGSAQIFEWLMEAAAFTRTAYDPGQARAVFGMPGTGAFSIPDYNNNWVFASIHGDRSGHDVPYHEFGHLVMYRRNTYRNPNAGGNHVIDQLYHPALAWSEGWATAFAQFINSDGYYDAANFITRPPVEDARNGGYSENTETEHNEMWVAAAMNDFYDVGEPAGGDDPADQIISFSEIMNIIKNHNLDSITEFYDEMNSSGYINQTERHYASRVMRYNEFDVPIEPETLPPSVTITGPNQVLEGQAFTSWQADVTNGDSPFSYEWRLDGSTTSQTSDTFIHIFNDPGTHQLEVEVTDDLNRSDDDGMFIEVVGYSGSSLAGAGTQDSLEINQFEIKSIYPNPFNPATTIQYALPEQAEVTLEVYNIMGRKVATLVNKTQEAGEYTPRFEAGGLASGIYFGRLTAKGISGHRWQKVIKMQLIK